MEKYLRRNNVLKKFKNLIISRKKPVNIYLIIFKKQNIRISPLKIYRFIIFDKNSKTVN